MLAALNAFDTQIFQAINGGLDSSVLDLAMTFISSKYTWIVAGVLAAIYLFRSRRDLIVFGIVVLLTIGISDALTYNVLKPVFARERPCRQFPSEHLRQQWCGGDYGFPSNHAANGMAVTVLMARRFRWRGGVVALALTLVVGFSRIYIGVHFPGDILGGLAFGAVFGLVCDQLYRLYERLAPKLRRKSV